MRVGSACILQARTLAARMAALPLPGDTGLVPSFFTTQPTFYCALQRALRYN